MIMTDGGTRWLSPAQQQAWLGLIAVVELLPGALDGQLQRDAGISHFEYMAMAMLSEARERTLENYNFGVADQFRLLPRCPM